MFSGAPLTEKDQLGIVDWAIEQVAKIKNGGDKLVEELASSSKLSSNARAKQFGAGMQHISSDIEALEAKSVDVSVALKAVESGLSKDDRLQWQAFVSQRKCKSTTDSLQRTAAMTLAELSTMPYFSDATPGDCGPAPVSNPAAVLQATVKWASDVSGVEMVLRRGAGGSVATDPADATEVHVSCSTALVAIVALESGGTPVAVRVVVGGANEAGFQCWSQSQLHVCRRISACAMRALEHFDSNPAVLPMTGKLRDMSHNKTVLESILLWITLYKDLFTKPCSACNQLLGADPAGKHLLPPVLRPFKVTRKQLLASVRGSVPSKAYHIHDATLDNF